MLKLPRSVGLVGAPKRRRTRFRLIGVGLVALFLLLGLPGERALAQVYGQVLPRSVVRLTISQQLIDIGHSPTLRPGSPSIAGTLEPGAEDVALAVFRTGARATPSPDDPPPQLIEEVEPGVDPDTGEFAAEIGTSLEPGAYALYVNSALAGVFTVQFPVVAAAGSSGPPLGMPSPTAMLGFGMLVAIGLGGVSLYLQLARQRA